MRGSLGDRGLRCVLGDHAAQGVDLVAQGHDVLVGLLMSCVVGDLHIADDGCERVHAVFVVFHGVVALVDVGACSYAASVRTDVDNVRLCEMRL